MAITNELSRRQTSQRRLTPFSLHLSFLLLSIFALACLPRRIGDRDFRQQPSVKEVSVVWKDERAVSISIPVRFVEKIDTDSIPLLLSVRLRGDSITKPRMLGHYLVGSNEIVFEPPIPFTRGLRYEIVLRNTRVAEVAIPEPDVSQAPSLLAVYPTCDTVPLNLLKMYLRFSKPMREGHSLENLVVLRDDRDTVDGVFLELQPELWNADGTLLTLWLDPGRIKRDLQPNKLLGTPLQQGGHYTLIISKDWKDTQGAPLEKSFYKRFSVTARDSLQPNPNAWKIKSPEVGTTNPMEINFIESLDFSLLLDVFQVVSEHGANIEGTVQVGYREKVLSFTPEKAWAVGKYTLKIETRLEDLAGNNLNRPFDKDLKSKSSVASEVKTIEKRFVIR